MAAAKLRVLLFSTLYPSSARPRHGLFVETRLRELVKSGEVDAKVVAPVPWFPSTDPRYGERARIARTPRAETRHGIDVVHPRYPLPPRVGQTVAPFVLALGALPAVRRLVRDGFDFDLIDAHYYYPDGVAAALLARHFGKPLVVTARGSDLNVLGRYRSARWMMRWAARQADASIGVCRALVEILRGWGAPAERLAVVRNGVDLVRFRPLARDAARARLAIDGAPVLLCVGNLVDVKGHDLAIDAFARIAPRHPRARLFIVGDGPLRGALEAHARERGVGDRVAFAGAVAQDELVAWYSAADALVLASKSEGWANVLLEAMACGTPVVATDVGGSAEVVADPAAGVLAERRDAEALGAAVETVLGAAADRARVRRYAEGFGWDATTAAQLGLFRRIAGAGR